MRYSEQDLLICAFGSAKAAKDLSQKFKDNFPRIRLCSTPGFMETLFLLENNRFHIVVFVVIGDFGSASRKMITKLCDLGYSKNAIFAYFADTPSLANNHFPVDSFAKGKIDELMAAAKKAGSLKLKANWSSAEELRRIDVAQNYYRQIGNKGGGNNHPPRKPWWKKLLGR